MNQQVCMKYSNRLLHNGSANEGKVAHHFNTVDTYTHTHTERQRQRQGQRQRERERERERERASRYSKEVQQGAKRFTKELRGGGEPA